MVIGQKTENSIFYTCLVLPFERGEKIQFNGKTLERIEVISVILENERKENGARSIRCKGVRPYERLQN